MPPQASMAASSLACSSSVHCASAKTLGQCWSGPAPGPAPPRLRTFLDTFLCTPAPPRPTVGTPLMTAGLQGALWLLMLAAPVGSQLLGWRAAQQLNMCLRRRPGGRVKLGNVGLTAPADPARVRSGRCGCSGASRRALVACPQLLTLVRVREFVSPRLPDSSRWAWRGPMSGRTGQCGVSKKVCGSQ